MDLGNSNIQMGMNGTTHWVFITHRDTEMEGLCP